ncbi:DPP IV N-terminal domain-containing protein [Bradyrhizobium sp. Arg62]|uniref:S9 family peptidase n=1 Tax=Bradyrhizobium TaxID=374 RepID=UPI001E3CC059|nr:MULTISPECIES: S9 family peptidase [Bradyrhizobium]MCC8938848.1 DPP IV N-terminal domain-containing protein [Bradyrhizobium ivorense]MCC8948861.1 DPP IV N-terminal domain-containing protein [Bradyrhizobium brasilense]
MLAFLAQQESAAAHAPADDIANPPLVQSDYERALTVGDRYGQLTVNVPDVPSWLPESEAFVYRRTTQGKRQFMLVNAATGVKRPAFDQIRLAAALNRRSHKNYKADDLPFARFKLTDNGQKLSFDIENTRWNCDLASYLCTSTQVRRWVSYDDTPPVENHSRKTSESPDGKWNAYIRNYNIFLRSKDGLQDVPLTWDGSEGNYYALSTLRWSPDSTHLAGYRIRPGDQRKIHYIESSPVDRIQPKHSTMTYPKPGDALALSQPVLFDIISRRVIAIDDIAFPNPYGLSPIQWWKDGRGFTFEYNRRGHQVYRLVEVDAATGQVRSLIEELSQTFIDYERLQPRTGKTFRYDVEDGKEIIWASERDGHEHLYLFNGRTGELKNQITRGDWVVRAVYYVDPIKRQIWFGASGSNPGEDPYFVHAYRIDFDGKGLTALTPEQANHHIEFSPGGRYYVDLWSRIDLPPRMVLYRASDNAKLVDVESADISDLIGVGWRPPLSFNAKGRDGKTDIWGVIHLPVNFDPNKRYPVVEDVYAGPHRSFVPKSFSTRVEPLTQLGFIVVQIDGMGTNNRSRAFHDVAWKNLKDGGFPDRIVWHKAASARYSWYDISNVGIFGTSAGGQNAVNALLFYPEFYKAAVANSGCYDNRLDKMGWSEQWMGWPVGIEYSQSSAIDNAHRLQGKLMLIVGEMDRNVDPSSTFQLADRLIKAGKYFDMLYVPGADHGAPGTYAELKLLDFFVRNILGQRPPNWNAVLTEMPKSKEGDNGAKTLDHSGRRAP